MAKKHNTRSLFERVAAESAIENEQLTNENNAKDKSSNAVLSSINNDAYASEHATAELNNDESTADVSVEEHDIIDDKPNAEQQPDVQEQHMTNVDEPEDDPLKQFKDMLPVNANAADRKKLELYDKLYNEFKAKTAENQQLTDKIVMYVDEIDSLKVEIKQLKESMQKQASHVVDNSCCISAEEIELLKEENNKLTLKIAQQAFEIATLKSNISAVPKPAALVANSVQPSQSARQSPKAVQYSYSKNGYSSWN